jgi:hypothetical protein
MRKCNSGNDLANNALVCPKCGHRFTSAPVKILAWFFVIATGIGLLAAMIGENTSQESRTSGNTSPVATTAAVGNSSKRMMTDSERNYLGASGSYLDETHMQAMNVARTMAGASDGSSTLGDVREALRTAKLVENAGYLGDYKDRINGNVPASCFGLSKNIEEIHRLFQAAMAELLEYWQDQNTEHIVSGNATLKRSILLMNSTIRASTAKMKEFMAR